MRVKKYAVQLYDRPTVPLDLKARMVKAEAVEALLYGSVTWTLRQEHYKKLRTVHHRVLLQGRSRDHRFYSRTAKPYRWLTAKALKRLSGRGDYCGRERLCG